MSFMDDIESLAKDNSGETNSLVGDAEQFADQKTGGQFDSEIQQGGDQLDSALGVDDQNQQQGN